MDCASGRGIVHSSLLPTPVVDPIQYQLEQKEIRELPVEHIKKLGDILAEDHQWKDLMSQIPGTKSGGKRFDTQDVGYVKLNFMLYCIWLPYKNYHYLP